MDLLQNSRQDEYNKFREANAIFRREDVKDSEGRWVIEDHDVICEVFKKF